MNNPFVHALLKSGLSAAELSRRLKISRQYISRLERGCAVNLSKPVVGWILRELEDDFEVLTSEGIQNWYKIWKTNKRMAILSARRIDLPVLYKDRILSLQSRGNLDDYLMTKSVTKTFDKEAFLKWRRTNWNSSYKFAMDMCITPAAVDAYEREISTKMSPEMREFIEWLANHSPVAEVNETVENE